MKFNETRIGLMKFMQNIKRNPKIKKDRILYLYRILY